MLAKFVRPIVYIYHRFDAFKNFIQHRKKENLCLLLKAKKHSVF